jgi:hypothetical protein
MIGYIVLHTSLAFKKKLEYWLKPAPDNSAIEKASKKKKK